MENVNCPGHTGWLTQYNTVVLCDQDLAPQYTNYA